MRRYKHMAFFINQHRAPKVAGIGARGQELEKCHAILVVQRPCIGNVVGHAEDVAPNQLGVLVRIGVRNDPRVFNDLFDRS